MTKANSKGFIEIPQVLYATLSKKIPLTLFARGQLKNNTLCIDLVGELLMIFLCMNRFSPIRILRSNRYKQKGIVKENLFIHKILLTLNNLFKWKTQMKW